MRIRKKNFVWYYRQVSADMKMKIIDICLISRVQIASGCSKGKMAWRVENKGSEIILSPNWNDSKALFCRILVPPPCHAQCFSKVQIVLGIPYFSFLKESLPSYKVNFIITLFIVFHLLIPSLLLIFTLLFTIFHMDSATFKYQKFRSVSFNGKMLLESIVFEMTDCGQ